MRLRYLKVHKKSKYTILFIKGKHNKNLKDIRETVTKRIDYITTNIKEERFNGNNLFICFRTNYLQK